MRLKFTKMHGLGNDFLVLDLVTQRFDLTPELIQTWGDRRTGIGFDQLLIIRPPSNPRQISATKSLMSMARKHSNAGTALVVLLNM